MSRFDRRGIDIAAEYGNVGVWLWAVGRKKGSEKNPEEKGIKREYR